MFHKISLSLVLLLMASVVWGQDNITTVKKVARPNIPGSFIVDLGVNRGLNTPDKFKQGFWGSRTVNLYYQYPIRFGKSKFSFNPGLGLSMERFKFVNRGILVDAIETTTTPVVQYNFIDGATIYPGIKKSMLVANYLEIPLEIRFDTNPNDIARSFSWAIGGRAGVLTNGMMKVKYKLDGDEVKMKDRKPHGLNPIRYGVYSRIGIGGFNWFAFYNLSELFEKDKGPDATTMNTLTVGISINGF